MRVADPNNAKTVITTNPATPIDLLHAGIPGQTIRPVKTVVDQQTSKAAFQNSSYAFHKILDFTSSPCTVSNFRNGSLVHPRPLFFTASGAKF